MEDLHGKYAILGWNSFNRDQQCLYGSLTKFQAYYL